MTDGFGSLWEKAAKIHGHKCPSLFYGTALILLAKRIATNEGISFEHIILEGSSKCIRDGIATGLRESNIQNNLLVLSNSPACALTIGTANNSRRFLIAPQVRQQINQWHQELPLTEFQSRGVSYLEGVKENELIHQETLSEQQFNQLCNQAQKYV